MHCRGFERPGPVAYEFGSGAGRSGTGSRMTDGGRFGWLHQCSADQRDVCQWSLGGVCQGTRVARLPTQAKPFGQARRRVLPSFNHPLKKNVVGP